MKHVLKAHLALAVITLCAHEENIIHSPFDRIPNEILYHIGQNVIESENPYNKQLIEQCNSFLKVSKRFNKVGEELCIKNIAANHKIPHIHAAVSLGRTSYVQTMIEQDKQLINLKEERFHLTPLHYAAIYNQPTIAQLLLKQSASINEKDKIGYTPLMFAIILDSDSVVDVLLNYFVKL